MVVFGIDEAGRGALCGPVAAACVSFNYTNFTFYSILQDSKKISPDKRIIASKIIKLNSVWGYGWSYPHEIDSINVHHASLLAMQRSYFHCIMHIQKNRDISKSKKEHSLACIDGKFCPKLPVACEALVKGDNYVPEIQAASILAKVARDEIMQLLHAIHPSYHMHIHKGYPTQKHKKAIRMYGLSSIHRKSFSIHDKE